MAQRISIAFHLLVLASVVSGRGHHHQPMDPSQMPYPDTTGPISIALPPSTASSPAPQKQPQHWAMPPRVSNILRSPSPAPSYVGKADEDSTLDGIVKSLGSPPLSAPAKDAIKKALDALPPMSGQAKDDLEREGAKAAGKILEGLAPKSSQGAIKDVLDKVGGIGGATDAIKDAISSSGSGVHEMISRALKPDSTSTTDGSTSDDEAKPSTTASDFQKIIAAAEEASRGESDVKKENAAFATRSSSLAGMIAIVAVTACFML